MLESRHQDVAANLLPDYGERLPLSSQRISAPLLTDWVLYDVDYTKKMMLPGLAVKCRRVRTTTQQAKHTHSIL